MVRQIAVSLHLGAHKTASTHLQKSLQKNESLLAENAVRYFGPKFLRHRDHAFLDLFGLRSHGQSVGDRDGPEQVEWLADGASTLVLSEENILGPVFNALNPGVLYPQADLKIERFNEKVAPHPVTIFLAIREPSSWLASLYSQRVIGGEFRGFEEFVGDNHPQQLKWSNLVDRLAKIPGDRKVYVWRKEDYPEVAAPVLRRMVGWKIGPLVGRIEGRVNAGLSSAAVAQLVDWGKSGRTGDPKDWAKEARQTFALGDANSIFDPWPETVKSQSRLAYADDLATIENLNGAEILKPSSRSRK